MYNEYKSMQWETHKKYMGQESVKLVSALKAVIYIKSGIWMGIIVRGLHFMTHFKLLLKLWKSVT